MFALASANATLGQQSLGGVDNEIATLDSHEGSSTPGHNFPSDFRLVVDKRASLDRDLGPSQTQELSRAIHLQQGETEHTDDVVQKHQS